MLRMTDNEARDAAAAQQAAENSLTAREREERDGQSVNLEKEEEKRAVEQAQKEAASSRANRDDADDDDDQFDDDGDSPFSAS